MTIGKFLPEVSWINKHSFCPFRNSGAKLSHHISLLEPGYRHEGPAFGGHSRQYQRRWAGTMRSWKRPTDQNNENIPPFFEQKFVEKEKVKNTNVNILDNYTYTVGFFKLFFNLIIFQYTFENSFEKKKGGTTFMTNQNNGNTTTHFPALL